MPVSNFGKPLFNQLNQVFENECLQRIPPVFVSYLSDNQMVQRAISKVSRGELYEVLPEEILKISTANSLYQGYLKTFSGVPTKALHATLGSYLREYFGKDGKELIVITNSHTRHLSYINHPLTRQHEKPDQTEQGNYLARIPLVQLKNKVE